MQVVTSLRILNIDDSATGAELINGQLSAAGCDVVSERVQTVDAVNAALAAKPWDVIICEYLMPDWNALDALAVVRSSGFSIPFIIVSGVAGEDIAVDAIHAGADDYICRDNMTRLLPAIERALKKSEEPARGSDTLYRRLFECTPDGAMIYGPEGNILEANPAVRRMLGYGQGEMVGLTAAYLVDPEDISCVTEALADIDSLPDTRRDLRLRKKDGSPFVAGVAASQLPDGKLLLIFRDITERKNAESESLRLSAEVVNQRELLKNIIANVPGIVWEVSNPPGEQDETGVFVSEYVSTMLGYSVEEWLATPNFWVSIVHPDHRERVVRSIVAAFVTGEPYVQEFPCIAKSGRTVWLEARSAVTFDANGNPAGVRGVSIDITERKRSETYLRQSEERYRNLVENAIDIIYEHDLNGNYKSVNRAAEKVTGYSVRELLSMNLAEIVAPEYLEKAGKMMAAKLDGKEETAYEIEIIAKDGRRVWIEVNTRLMYEDGVPVSVQGIARDASRRKNLEDKFRQTQKMEAIGLLAGGIAHDFNNLITAITGFSELTLKSMAADDPLRGNIEEINATGYRAAALTGRLLAFSRKQAVEPAIHNLNSVISNIESMLRRIIRESVEFEIILDADLQNVKADAGQLEQVIMNLAINAQDAMPDGGKLTFTTENIIVYHRDETRPVKAPPGSYVKMTVTDTGQGIDDKIVDSIFEPFFTTKPSGKGSGLGLSTVYSIIKQAGGKVFVSSAKDIGTTFEVYLPSVGRGASIPVPPAVIKQIYSGTETVLLVEDDESVRSLVKEILISGGYTVLEASCGQNAIDICESHPEPIDILLTDLVMPKMTGTELTARVKLLRPEAKALVMTGYFEQSIPAHETPNPPVASLEKPFTAEALGRKIREVLES